MLLSNTMKISNRFVQHYKISSNQSFKPIYRFSTSELTDLVNKTNYYEILGVKQNSDIKENFTKTIKKNNKI